jgi:hypothetical protein
MGFYGGESARLMATSPTLRAKPQPAPTIDPITGVTACEWAQAWTLHAQPEWTSGLYMAVFTSAGGSRSCAPFVVRDPARRGGLCIVAPFTTYQAYNQFPVDQATGKNAYYGFDENGAEHNTLRAREVSFDRPYGRNGIPDRFEFDLDFIRWAEQLGYDLAYVSSLDLHAGRVEPTQYAGLLFIGHDEYWSREMREHATGALEAGTGLAFFEANNVYWHIRVQRAPDGRTDRGFAIYKHDPDPNAASSGPTTQWRQIDADGAEAEQALLGVQFNGIPSAATALLVRASDHWFWAGTGVADGDAIDGVVGGEADGYDPAFPSPIGVTPTMLSHTPYDYPPGVEKIQNSSIYETEAGAVVFASATNDWPAVLGRDGRRDGRIQLATANLLDRMLAVRAERDAPAPTVRPDGFWRRLRRR